MLSARGAFALLFLLCALVWWQATRPRAGDATTHAHATSSAPPCPLPPRLQRGAPPLQSPVPAGLALATIDEARVTPLAGFSLEARVLGRKDYRMGREADFSPTDLALGWGRMAEDAVLAQLHISQGGRWYRYRWRDAGPPIPADEIVRSSANMHLIPADDAVAADLRRVEAGDRVRIDGWLVEVAGGDGGRWRSSLTRDDSGAGACELIYACSITRE